MDSTGVDAAVERGTCRKAALLQTPSTDPSRNGHCRIRSDELRRGNSRPCLSEERHGDIPAERSEAGIVKPLGVDPGTTAGVEHTRWSVLGSQESLPKLVAVAIR